MNYRVITDYERYKIYDNGTVYSEVNHKFLNPTKCGRDRKYLAVCLCNQNGTKAGNSSELGIGTSSELELKSENY